MADNLDPCKFVFGDGETGGYDAKSCGLCSWCMVLMDAWLETIALYYVLIKDSTDLRYEPDSMAVHGLDYNVLQRSALPMENAAKAIRRTLAGRILVGCNIKFDMRFMLARGIEVCDHIELMDMAKVIFPDIKTQIKQEELARRLEVPVHPTHNAMFDCLTGVGCFRRLAEHPSMGKIDKYIKQYTWSPKP